MLRHLKEVKFKATEQFQTSLFSKEARNIVAPQHSETTGLILIYGIN